LKYTKYSCEKLPSSEPKFSRNLLSPNYAVLPQKNCPPLQEGRGSLEKQLPFAASAQVDDDIVDFAAGAAYAGIHGIIAVGRLKIDLVGFADAASADSIAEPFMYGFHVRHNITTFPESR
jgi:hypothetical protein